MDRRNRRARRVPHRHGLKRVRRRGRSLGISSTTGHGSGQSCVDLPVAYVTWENTEEEFDRALDVGRPRAAGSRGRGPDGRGRAEPPRCSSADPGERVAGPACLTARRWELDRHADHRRGHRRPVRRRRAGDRHGPRIRRAVPLGAQARRRALSDPALRHSPAGSGARPGAVQRHRAHTPGLRRFEDITLHLQLGDTPPQPGQLLMILTRQPLGLTPLNAATLDPVPQGPTVDPGPWPPERSACPSPARSAPHPRELRRE